MIPYGRQTIDEDDIRAVVEVLRSERLTQGPKVGEFEAALARACGAPHAVAFANGTLALAAAYHAAGLGEGDEIVTSPLTFAATATAALWLGARPVFADVDSETGNLDPAAARAAVTPRARVLAPVDYAGRPADLDAFAALGRERGLVVVEDACHALGARLGDRPVGAFSDMTVLSFHPVKSITTGEGGAVLAMDPERDARLRAFREHGVSVRHPDWRYEVTGPGLNGRLTDIQSALGLSQLPKLKGFIGKREEIAGAYARDLGGVDELALPPPAGPGECAWHLYPVRLRLERLRVSRGEVFSDLRAAGIGVQVHYIPVYWHPLYQELGYRKGLCPRAEAFSEAEISLPIYPTLSEADRRRVVETLKRLLAGYARAGGPGGARVGSR